MSNSITLPEQNNGIVPSPRPLDSNPAAVYLAGLGETSRRTMRQALDKIAAILSSDQVTDCLALDWSAVRYQHVTAIRSKLVEMYAPETANRFLAALRGALKAAWRLNLMTAEDYQKAADVKPVRGETIPAGRELTPGEMAALMANCEADEPPAGVRDAALIAVTYSAGLRREEVVNLDLESYEAETGKLTILKAKGNKQRTTYLANGAKDALEDWLIIRGNDPGALFWPILKSGKLRPRRLTAQAVYNLFSSRAVKAGVKSFSPHDLRRTFVSDLLDAGADIVTVAKLAGHANVTTTARYDRRTEQTKQKAAGLLHVPYRSKRKP